MATVTVRYWRGAWVVDVWDKVNGRRKRLIKAFGPGTPGKAAAEAYRDEIAPQTKTPKFWERYNATFRDLWNKFEAQLAGPVPGPPPLPITRLSPSTISCRSSAIACCARSTPRR